MQNRIRLLILLLFLIIGLSFIDIFANAVSAVPFIGDILETASETMLESLQIILTGLGFFVIKKGA